MLDSTWEKKIGEERVIIRPAILMIHTAPITLATSSIFNLYHLKLSHKLTFGHFWAQNTISIYPHFLHASRANSLHPWQIRVNFFIFSKTFPLPIEPYLTKAKASQYSMLTSWNPTQTKTEFEDENFIQLILPSQRWLFLVD